ncbi:MAG: hypothetical protein WCG91_03445 [Candidatus Shapirobacteria bacterium]
MEKKVKIELELSFEQVVEMLKEQSYSQELLVIIMQNLKGKFSFDQWQSAYKENGSIPWFGGFPVITLYLMMEEAKYLEQWQFIKKEGKIFSHMVERAENAIDFLTPKPNITTVTLTEYNDNHL